MSFSLLCMISLVTTLPFGLAFLFIPEYISSHYSIAGWNSGTASVARLFGIELLYVAGASFGLMRCTDVRVQRRIAVAFSLVSALATVVVIQTILSGAAGPFHWTTAALYVFFAVAWGLFAMRHDPSHT